MSQNFQDQNLIYLYDLPKIDTTSTRLAEAFKSQAGVQIDGKPQIRRDIARPFYTGIVQIKDSLQFEEASEKMKFFEIEGKMCRALKFDKTLLGSNKDKLINNNIFIRNIPRESKLQDLHDKYAQFGKIKSLKISLNPDHSSRGYGFVCFEEQDDAGKAVDGTCNDDDSISMKFQPKDRRSMHSLINNVYVKNIPLEMNDNEVRELFAPFGHIKSLVLQKNKLGQFGFVCFDDPNNEDKEYGPQCAQKAIAALHQRDMSNNLKLYVRQAMKKQDREKETLRFKTSKKRCNLYVKNFPAQWAENDLQLLFKQFGEIERIRLEKKGNNAFAFVCFKEPAAAAQAKQTLHNHTIEGKALMINYYEIKQLREVQKEEAIDKSDFEKYQAQQNGGFHLNDLISHPHMTQILQQLLEIMQQNEAMNAHFNNSERNMMRGQRQHHNKGYHHANRHHQGQNMQPMNNIQQPIHGQPMQGLQPGPPTAGMRQPQPPMSQMPPQPGMNQMQPNMPQMPGLPQQVQNTSQMTPNQRYMAVTMKLLPSVTEKNPYLKEQVGQAIFEFVNMLVPADRAPKITGMLIELPVDQIKAIMSSLDALSAKVKEATELIDQAEKQGHNTH